MKCPKCGKNMILGEIANSRGDSYFYWASKDFFDKHWFNTYSHTKKTIVENDGMIIKANGKFKEATPCFGCRDCKLIVVDCNK